MPEHINIPQIVDSFIKLKLIPLLYGIDVSVVQSVITHLDGYWAGEVKESAVKNNDVFFKSLKLTAIWC